MQHVLRHNERLKKCQLIVRMIELKLDEESIEPLKLGLSNSSLFAEITDG